MKTGLLAALEARMDAFTPAERQIANYVLTNRNDIPFETAASLATKLNVSAVTVGRFCRLLGYKHFRALKEDLRQNIGEAPWLVGDQLTQFRERYDDKQEMRQSLEQEMASLVEIYRMAETPQWKAVLSLIVRSELVQVTGFQTERGLGYLLAHSLQYVREGVEMPDPASGNYADIFARSARKRCLILIDIRRYSRQSYLIAERAAAVKIPLIVITDKYCDWARRFTPHVLAVPSASVQFWISPAAMACLINLLVNGVAARSGAAVEKRLEQVSSLFEEFTGFIMPGGRRGKPRS